MIRLATELVAFFASHGVLLPEIAAASNITTGTYLISLPDTPDAAISLGVYDNRHRTLTAKETTLAQIQITVRSRKRSEAVAMLNPVYHFLLGIAEGTDFISDFGGGFGIFDCRRGPMEIGQDEKGRYLWELSFTVTTNLF